LPIDSTDHAVGLERKLVGMRAFFVPQTAAMLGINLICSKHFALLPMRLAAK
jgi:hypothetical protein